MIATYAIFVPLLPLLGAALSGALGRPVLRARTHWAVIMGVAGTFACSVAIFILYGAAHGEHVGIRLPVYNWIAAGLERGFNVEFLVDPLTIIMLLTVTGVSLLVVIYSRDYMRHADHPVRGYERFFAFLGLFVFSMCTLVLAGNFLLLYLGWEAVGLCSYLLIGFYYDKPSAAAASKKAFLVNRVGDFGFGLGVLLIYLTFGSLSYHTVFDMVKEGMTAGGDPLTSGRLTTMALLLFCGAIGKSAQLPLHVWLPDAMEGPTPVSALIHAATMVTAGVYMVARCGVIFTASEGVMNLVAIVGGVTALFAATIALTQHDMKRILAYSTISQLGYMFLGLGVYAAGAAIFHLFTHAFFKALLFLGAGSVMHAMGGIIDLRQFGGLKKVLPWTYRTFLIGGLALAGFPLFSGFFSKDEIIHAAIARQPVLGIMALATAVLTAFYTFRMFYRAFHGPTRVPPGVHPHESGAWMLVPLFVLAMGAAGAGFVNVQFARGGFLGFLVPHGWLAHFLEPALEAFGAQVTASEAPAPGGHFSQYGLLYVAALLAIAGIAAARYVYVRRPVLAERAAAAAPRVYRVLFNKYYVDELYDRAIVQPLWRLGRACFAIDNYFIDGLLWLITAIPRGLAFVLRTVQAGALQGYGLAMLAGFIILLILALRYNMDTWILTITIFLPLAGAALISLIPAERAASIRRAALTVSTLVLLMAVIAALRYGAAREAHPDAGYQLLARTAWFSSSAPGAIDIGYKVGIDGISVWLLLLTAFLTPLAIWASFSGINERVREYYALLLILEAAMLGVFCALDLLLFYVFFEFTLIPLYFIIGIWGGAARRQAANKFFIFTLAGSMLTFAGVLYTAYFAFTKTGEFTLDLVKLVQVGQSGAIPFGVQWWLFLAFAAGFAIKVPLFPVHTWLPLAHTEAPTAGSVILAGVLLKLGTYGFCRISLAMLPAAAAALAPFMATLAIIGIIYGALAAWVQRDVKKLVAYSSVSHLGFCMLGLFSLKLAGVSGAVLLMVNHGLSTGALFLIVGMIYERYHTRDVHAIGGLARPMPWMAFFLVVFTLSSIGLPGLNGFVSEFLVLLGTALSGNTTDQFAAGPLGYAYVVPAAVGIILSAVYMLWMCQRVLFGPLTEPPHTPDTSRGLSPDLTRREIAILTPIALACLLIGVYPNPLLKSMNTSIAANILASRHLSQVAAAPQGGTALAAGEIRPALPDERTVR